MSQSQHVLIIGTVWPEPTSSAAGVRMMQLITLFQAKKWKITFASAAAESDYRADLEAIGIDQKEIELNSSSFDEFIKDLQPAIVVFDRFMTEEQFGWRVAEQCPEALRVLDTEDLHCLRKARRRAVKKGVEFQKVNLLSEELAKREIASIYRCDLSLIISEVEMSLLKDLFQVEHSLLHYVPFLLDSEGGFPKESWPAYNNRHHFVSIGNYRHPPNLDAMRHLKEKIWPLIHEKLPQVEMHSYGSYPTQSAEALNDPEHGFYVKGRAENALDVVRKARVTLAPLRFGAGLKGKLIESMLCGTPSVTTEVGAEGIAGELMWGGAITNDSEQFARAAVKLYTDKSAWFRAQKNGVQIINKRFLNPSFGTELLKRMRVLQANLHSHRRRNFIGQMLQHHQMASTMYMSRWIEAKNRNR